MTSMTFNDSSDCPNTIAGRKSKGNEINQERLLRLNTASVS